MSALLIKNVPPELHERLRRRAAAHHRSMNRELIAILENELGAAGPVEMPALAKGLKPADGKWIARVIRNARDGKR